MLIEKSANFGVFFPMHKFSLYIFLHDATQGFQIAKLLDIHEQIKELRIFFKMAPRTNFLLNVFYFYIRIKITHENHVVKFRILDYLVFILMPFLNG